VKPLTFSNQHAAAIEVKGLVKRYGNTTAVDDLSFDVCTGEIFGLLGPNGAGKTTTVECIEGLRAPDAGEIRVLGFDVRRELGPIKERIGIQLQTTNLYHRLTVREVVDLFASFYRSPLEPERVIELTDLREKETTRTKQLSGGQQQRLSIALALVNDPDVLFLDEPTTGLDPQARHKMWDVIEELHAQHKTILMTTHHMDEAERLCNRVAIVDHGKIIALDQPQALVRQHFQEQAIEFKARQRPAAGELARLAGVAHVTVNDDAVTCYSTDVPGTMSGLLELARNGAIAFDDLVVRRATLEDVFLKLTGRRIRD
jgi:ABC-2 type transport system ATP-binding protein